MAIETIVIRHEHATVGTAYDYLINNCGQLGDGLFLVTSEMEAGSNTTIALIMYGVLSSWFSVPNPLSEVRKAMMTMPTELEVSSQESLRDEPVIRGFVSENAMIKMLAIAANPDLIKDIDLS